MDDAAALEFDHFVRALSMSPNDPDERENTGDGCVCSHCRDGFHGRKLARRSAFPAVPKVTESTGTDMTLVTPQGGAGASVGAVVAPHLIATL